MMMGGCSQAAEHMLIHVDLKTRSASMPKMILVISRTGLIYDAHKKTTQPAQKG